MFILSKTITISLLLLCVCVFTYGILNLTEGSKCDFVDNTGNRSGECVKYFTCLTLVVDFLYSDSHIEICSFDGYLPIICCTGCERVPDIRNSYMSPLRYLHYETGNKARDKCQEYSLQIEGTVCRGPGGRISYDRFLSETDDCDTLGYWYDMAGGGRDALPTEYPHMALLGYGKAPSIQWKCGGSLISEKFILTAGHCISTREDGPVTYATVGLLQRKEIHAMRGRSQRRAIRNIIKHPEYKPPSKYHDIALLEVDVAVTLNRNVIPACLPLAEDLENLHIYEKIMPVTATGWGAMGYRAQLADTLQVVTVTDFGEESCKQQYRSSFYRHLKAGYNHTTQMCYGSRDKPIDTCEGDSGGPLQINIGCMYTILGVTSSGHPCGEPNRAGLYSRVMFYVPWIVNTIWSDDSTHHLHNWEKHIRKLYKENPKYKKDSKDIVFKTAHVSDNSMSKETSSKKSDEFPEKSVENSNIWPKKSLSKTSFEAYSSYEDTLSEESFYESDSSSEEYWREIFSPVDSKLKRIEIEKRFDIFHEDSRGDLTTTEKPDLISNKYPTTSNSLQQFSNDSIAPDILKQLFDSASEKISDLTTEQHVSLSENMTKRTTDGVKPDLMMEQYVSFSDSMTETTSNSVKPDLSLEQYASLSDNVTETTSNSEKLDLTLEQYASLSDNMTEITSDGVKPDLTMEQYVSSSGNLTETTSEGVKPDLKMEQYASFYDTMTETTSDSVIPGLTLEQYASLSDNMTETTSDGVKPDLTMEQYVSSSDNLTETTSEGVKPDMTMEQYASLSDSMAETLDLSDKMLNKSSSTRNAHTLVHLFVINIFVRLFLLCKHN